MAPFTKGDKYDPPIKILEKNRLSMLQPLQDDNLKTLTSTYTSEFPLRSLNTLNPRPFSYPPATEISKDIHHFGKQATEFRHQYDEKLPRLEPAIRSDRVDKVSIQMHVDKRIGTNCQSSYSEEFPAQTGISRREKCLPSTETVDRILPRARTVEILVSEQQDKFRNLVEGKEEKTDVALKTNKTYRPLNTIQGDHCKRYQTTNMDTFQGKWAPSAPKAPVQYSSSVLNLDPREKIGQSTYHDKFKILPTTDGNQPTLNDFVKKCSIRPWDDTHSYATSNQEDYTPKIVNAKIVKPLLPQTHSDLPVGDLDPTREANRQQFNSYRHFYTQPPASGLIQTHVDGSAVRTKSNIQFVESAQWDRSTTNSNMFRPVRIIEIPRRYRPQPPGTIPLKCYDDPVGHSTTHSDFQPKCLPPNSTFGTLSKRKVFLLSGGKFRSETTQRTDYPAYHVKPRRKIESYRRQFSSVPLGTLNISI